MRQRLLLASLALVLAALAIGCGAGDPPENDIASTQQALSTDLYEMPQNGYPPPGLDLNYALLSNIWLQPLNDMGVAATLGTVAPRLFNTGLPTSAEHLMDEIVSCALDSGNDVSYSVNGTMYTSRGKFGLCDGNSPFGNWRISSAIETCKYMVSGCILARMNALGKHVPISIRVPEQLVGGQQNFRPAQRVRVATYRRSDGKGAADGWQPDFVGICTRHTTVTLQRTSAAKEQAVRVCTGIHACDPDSTEYIVPGSLRIYSGFLADFAPGSESISFPCPEASTAPNENSERAYFSILTSPGPVGGPSHDPMLIISDPTTTYPAPERDVFTYVEGAYYGNILTDYANWDRNACYSDPWQAGEWYLTERNCILGPPCSIRSGPCDQDSGGRDTTGGQAFYDFTLEKFPRSWYGVTVFLNDPNAISTDSAIEAVHDVCTPGALMVNDGTNSVVTSICAADPYCCSAAWDNRCVNEIQTVANSQACGTVHCSHPVCTTGAALTKGCSPVVTSVCAADPYCCNTAWDSICVNEVQTIANSPACTCSHPVCTPGAQLSNGCSPVVTSICAADPYCCNTAWDSTCIQEVQTVANSEECIPP